MLFEFVWSNFYPLCSGLDQGELEITVIGIIDYGGVTSSFGCYLYSASKVDNTGYISLISNAHKLKKYILITMNCCNRRLLLPLEGDGLMGDDIILLVWGERGKLWWEGPSLIHNQSFLGFSPNFINQSVVSPYWYSSHISDIGLLSNDIDSRPEFNYWSVTNPH